MVEMTEKPNVLVLIRTKAREGAAPVPISNRKEEEAAVQNPPQAAEEAAVAAERARASRIPLTADGLKDNFMIPKQNLVRFS